MIHPHVIWKSYRGHSLFRAGSFKYTFLQLKRMNKLCVCGKKTSKTLTKRVLDCETEIKSIEREGEVNTIVQEKATLNYQILTGSQGARYLPSKRLTCY